MIKSSVLHRSTSLKQVSSGFAISLVLVLSFLSLRFGPAHISHPEAISKEHTVKAFFAKHQGFVVLNKHQTPTGWSQAIPEIKPVELGWLASTVFKLGGLSLFPEGSGLSVKMCADKARSYYP